MASAAQRRVSITHQRPDPDNHNLQISATMLEPSVTDSHPVRLRITVANDGQARRMTVHSGCPMFSKYDWASNPFGVFLADARSPSWVAESGPQWIIEPPTEPGRGGYFGDGGCGAVAYSSGQSRTFEYDLYDDGRIQGYLDSRRYNFSNTFLLTPTLETSRHGEGTKRLYWELGVRIER